MKQTNDEFEQAFRKAYDSASRSFFTSFESISEDDIKSMTTLAFYTGMVAAFKDINDMLKN